MIPEIKSYCDSLAGGFGQIPQPRKELLVKIADYVRGKWKQNEPVNLVYVCTHNSRRSHFGQIWAHIAADYYSVKNVRSFSGGTEVTAFNPNAIDAIRRVGFIVKTKAHTENPYYELTFSKTEAPIICFSKKYDDQTNPQTEFAAIMTCGEAEVNCPFVPGAALRMSTTYEDPKEFDGTEQQDAMYDQRCRQIATEIFYMFSLIK